MPGGRGEAGSHLFQEGVGERLDAELEGAEVGGLVQALHLLGHERLVDRLALGVRGVHCGARVTASSARAAGREEERQAGKTPGCAYVQLEQIVFKNSKKMRSTSARYSWGTSFPWPEEPPPSFEGEVRLIRRCPAWLRVLVPFGPSALDLLSASRSPNRPMNAYWLGSPLSSSESLPSSSPSGDDPCGLCLPDVDGRDCVDSYIVGCDTLSGTCANGFPCMCEIDCDRDARPSVADAAFNGACGR